LLGTNTVVFLRNTTSISNKTCIIYRSEHVQELWKVVMHTLEKTVVLPPLTDPRQVTLVSRIIYSL